MFLGQRHNAQPQGAKLSRLRVVEPQHADRPLRCGRPRLNTAVFEYTQVIAQQDLTGVGNVLHSLRAIAPDAAVDQVVIICAERGVDGDGQEVLDGERAAQKSQLLAL